MVCDEFNIDDTDTTSIGIWVAENQVDGYPLSAVAVRDRNKRGSMIADVHRFTIGGGARKSEFESLIIARPYRKPRTKDVSLCLFYPNEQMGRTDDSDSDWDDDGFDCEGQVPGNDSSSPYAGNEPEDINTDFGSGFSFSPVLHADVFNTPGDVQNIAILPKDRNVDRYLVESLLRKSIVPLTASQRTADWFLLKTGIYVCGNYPRESEMGHPGYMFSCTNDQRRAHGPLLRVLAPCWGESPETLCKSEGRDAHWDNK